MLMPELYRSKQNLCEIRFINQEERINYAK